MTTESTNAPDAERRDGSDLSEGLGDCNRSETMDEDQVIQLAVRNGLGRTMRPIGMQTGDVFVTDMGYRTGELLAFAEAVQSPQREQITLLATMLEDCAERLAFVSGGGEHTVSHKYLKAAEAVLRPNVRAKPTTEAAP